jgi:hypothetical protein
MLDGYGGAVAEGETPQIDILTVEILPVSKGRIDVYSMQPAIQRSVASTGSASERTVLCCHAPASHSWCRFVFDAGMPASGGITF